jgi:hypothetical protein
MQRWRPVVALLAALLITAVVPPTTQGQYFGRNKVQYDQFDFRTLETDHFVFYYYPAEERAVRDAARMAERWYTRHTQVFLHRFDEKKPIIFYANDADFQQTNVTEQTIGPGTGGFTEPLRERVVMPFATSYGETNHVLGHELVHSFQYDLALNSDSLNIRLQNLPLWMIEGMAEYLSLGRQDTHTAMWMRDAILNDNMPTFEELANPREYFPYRYGQAHLAYVAGKYGDQSVTNLYKLGGRVGLDSAYVSLFGVSADSLTQEWAQATREAYRPLMENRTAPDSAGTKVLAPDIDGGRINIAPTLSPDGRYVAFISERELFNFNLFVADAETGEVIADLDRAGTTGHFNALRFINSAGTWSPDGRRLAFVSFSEGDNQITIWNVLDEEIQRSFAVKGVTSMKNPAWSPDGTKLAFTGTDGGISDLYVLNLKTENVRQLTNDRYADLQPTWSPDGETIAFTTDRRETTLNLLAPSSKMDIGLIDVESGDITIRDPFGDALHHNPQFSPDGRSLYFISDQDGFKDVYRMVLSSGDLYRVTHLKTGVSGITALSPAMSVASERGSMMFSVYGDGRYTGFRLPREDVQGTPLDPSTARQGASPRPATDTTDARPADPQPPADTTAVAARTSASGSPPPAAVLPPQGASGGLVASGLQNARRGLPPASKEYESDDYDPTLTLEGIAPPRVGASVGGPFGGGVSGGVALQFGDMLGHQKLIAALQAQGTFRDIGGGISYMNRRNQLNWGGSLTHTPIISQANTLRLDPTSAASVVRRLFITSASANASYPLSTTRRFEFSLSGTRFGYGVNIRELGFSGDLSLGELNQILEEQNRGFRFPEERDTEYLASARAAYVRDFSTSGLTGPIRGGRWRLEVSPTTGSQNFVTARADIRRYFHAAPFTFALQALHVGNYGAEFQNDVGLGGIGNEYIGYPYSQGFVRGYNVREIAEGIRETGRCTEVQGNASRCAELERLFGTRALTTRAEIRVPLLGPERLSLIPFQYLPTTLAVFTDAGVTWTNDEGPDFTTFDDNSAATNIPVVSTGVAARFNVLGSLLLEMYYARPFQRTDTTWEWGLRISPGF